MKTERRDRDMLRFVGGIWDMRDHKFDQVSSSYESHDLRETLKSIYLFHKWPGRNRTSKGVK